MYAGAEEVNANSLQQLSVEIIARLAGNGITSFHQLSACVASLPEPFSQISVRCSGP